MIASRVPRQWFRAGSTLVLCAFVSEGLFAQETYFKASNTDLGDRMGQSLAFSGDTLVVGAPSESSNATGVGGDESDNSRVQAGAVYVFRRSGSTWQQEAYLKASNTGNRDDFGTSVDLDGDTLVVGAPGEASRDSWVAPNQFNNMFPDAGAAYVFQRTGSTWSQEAYLKSLDPDSHDRFGTSVAVSGSFVAVSAPFEDSSSSGIGGDSSNNDRLGSGCVYVFERSGSSWQLDAYVKASPLSVADAQFGNDIDLDGNTLLVGAEHHPPFAMVGTDDAGLAYVYVRSATAWELESELFASDGVGPLGDGFGTSVALDGDTALIGTIYDEGAGANAAGAAYAFERTGTQWSSGSALTASDALALDFFGVHVALSGSTAVVSSGVGSPSSFGRARAYVFRRIGTGWGQNQVILPPATTTGPEDGFASVAALAGGSVFLGAPGEESSATGINGDLEDDSAFWAGAVFEFLLDPPSVPPSIGLSHCNGDGGDQAGCTDCPCGNNAPPGTTGGCLNSSVRAAQLVADGDLSVSLPAGSVSDLRFSIYGAPGNAFCVLNSGAALAPQNLMNPCVGLGSGVQSMSFDGLRCAIESVRRHGGRPCDVFGTVGVTNNPWGGEGGPPAGLATAFGGFTAGQVAYFQATFRDLPDLVCMRGLNTTQAIELTFTP